MGNSEKGSERFSKCCASSEKLSTHFLNGVIIENKSGFMAIEIKAPAKIRLIPCVGKIPNATPNPATINENSPICDKLAATVNAVLSG